MSFSDGQLGFMPGVGTTDAIFVIRTVHEKNRERQSNMPLEMVSVDLQKAEDTVLLRAMEAHKDGTILCEFF